MFLYNVSAYGKYASGSDVRMSEPTGFDFRIRLDADDISFIGLTDKEPVDMIVRVLSDGRFDDIAFVSESGMSTPLREQIPACIAIADDFGCSEAVSSGNIADAVRIISTEQDQEIVLYNCAFFDLNARLYNGYEVFVFSDGVKVIEKSEDITHHVFHDWSVCGGVPLSDAEYFLDKYTRFDDNTDVSESYAEEVSDIMSDKYVEAAREEMREMLSSADMQVGALQAVYSNSYGSYAGSDEQYSLQSVRSALAHCAGRTGQKSTDK